MDSSRNLINFKESFSDFKDHRLSFSVSSRKILSDIGMMEYLSIFFMYCDLRQIESVFGSTTCFSRLYGGRLVLGKHELTANHLSCLDEHGIHLALTLTNHFFDKAAYKESWPLLETHHQQGNSIICTNDQLALSLRRDFPLYELKASIIKRIDTKDKVNRALEKYDSLTLPMDKNGDDAFLSSLPEKSRLILFGNATCAYTCPRRSCYLGFSQEIFGKKVTSDCCQPQLKGLDVGNVFFDVKKLADLGFTRIKLLPLAPKGSVEACRILSQENSWGKQDRRNT